MENLELDVLQSIFDGSMQARNVKLTALQSITKNFSKDRIIGEGGFATVYKGVLQNGEIAVKRIKNMHTISEKLFHREVKSLLMAKHKNIVRFLGFCAHTEQKPYQPEGSSEYILYEDRERILCFEYINNGSLENYIADELRGLQWDTRYLIIKGICEGLHYLHTEKRIMHMDLKPANILIDDNMVAKITDFGLSRMVDNSQTKTKNLFFTPGYSAPEFIDSRIMSPSYDVYSLGVIISQLVSGHRSIPDRNNVFRRWSHRWHKSGKETPFRYQQIAKLVEIGLLCQEKDPNKRPSISDIINVLNELESTDRRINNTNKSTVGGHVIPYLEDDMLGIEPLTLRFPIELNTLIPASLEITNETNAYFAFIIQTTSLLQYCIQPNKHIVAPRSKYSVKITLQPLDQAPQDWQYIGDFIVRSTKVHENLISEDITEDIFDGEEGKSVDEVNLMITYKAEIPPVDVSLGSPSITDTRNLHGAQESNVSQREEESKISSLTSDELIQLDPPELCMPNWPNNQIKFIVNVLNTTDFYVAFNLYYITRNAARHKQSWETGILPPRSTKRCILHWITGGDEPGTDCFVWNRVVTEGVERGDIVGYMFEEESKKLPVIVNKVSPCPSNGMINFDPPELSLPFVPNKPLVFSVNIVNNTDYCVGFARYHPKTNVGLYYIELESGVLPPRSTQRLVVTRDRNINEQDDMQCQDKFFLWSTLVSEVVEDSNIFENINLNGSKELPIFYKKTSLCAPDELIQLDPPQFSFPFLQNKTVSMFGFFKIVNITDQSVGFNIWVKNYNCADYFVEPRAGILPPQSTQTIKVRRTLKKEKQEDMQCKDKITVRTGIVTQGVEVSDLLTYDSFERKELTVVRTKVSPCPSNGLIHFDPPKISLPFLPNKPLVFSVNIVNNTDYCIGFSRYHPKTNVGVYYIVPSGGVMPPRSTQRLVVRRVPEKDDQQEMQCQDKFFLWTCLVNEGVEAGDIINYGEYEGSKELPIVYKKRRLYASDELIQFDPPQLSFPFLPNTRVSKFCFLKIVNVTDHSVGFIIWQNKSNSADYKTEPDERILPPRSTQAIKVRRTLKKEEPEDIQCKDKITVWTGIVTEGVEVSDLLTYWSKEDKELPVVLTKPGGSSSS